MRYLYPTSAILAVVALIIVGLIRFLIHRLSSPLRQIPGPRIAAATGLWLWLHDMQGTAPRTIKNLHSRFGPIVRIGPEEVSINDVAVHNDVLYCQAPKFMKAAYFYDPFKTGPSGMFQAQESKEHSALRRLASKAFSRRSVLQFEPQIHDSLSMLSSILLEKSSTKTPFCLSKMSRCLSLDFISKFTYGKSLDAVKVPDFDHSLLEAFDSFAVSNYMVLIQFMMLPSLRAAFITILSLIPAKAFQAIPKMREGVREALALYHDSQKDKEDATFQPLLQSEQQAALSQGAPLSQEFLIADGVADIFAGTDTTSTTLTMTLREIFAAPQIHSRLHQELKDAIPSWDTCPSLTQLESLPYLSACVKEGVRHSTPVRSRLPRVCPVSGYTYNGYYLPPGTLISSSPYLMDYNEKVYPDPHKYNPDRWLTDDAATLKTLETGWAPFSRGSRGCIGINLALAEIYITIGTLIRRFRLEGGLDRDLKTREIFGVIFDEEVTTYLSRVDD